ncbi:hypothetical protein ABNB59_20145 [Paenibacillus larvae]|uniref:hypothetical protein n=1 Tax=Paenibacillus larvae TaxID=1464 RepID=UPI0001693F68
MQTMGIEAIYPKPNLSKRLHAKYTHLYLLRGLTIDQAESGLGNRHHVSSDGKGFMYVFNITRLVHP